MPLQHCVDHHWAPEVVHYFDSSYVDSLYSTPSHDVHSVSSERSSGKPFKLLIRKIWTASSSINPRRMNSCNRRMIELTLSYVEPSSVDTFKRGVMLVAKDSKHCLICSLYI